MDAPTENEKRSRNKLGELAAAGDRFALETLLDELPFEAEAVQGEMGIPSQRAKGILAGGKECLSLRRERVSVTVQYSWIPPHVCIGSLRLRRTDSQSPKAT
jgi:hypothetical protein